MNHRIAALVVTLLALCAQGFAAADKKGLKFAGCSISSVAYMKDMAKAFETKFGTPVEVKGGGVPVGIRQNIDGKVELAGSCRHLLEHEIKAGEKSTVVGYDMLVIIVHPDNPVSALTTEQVRQIFGGKISKWSAVGGEDKPIVLVGREAEDAGVATMFKEMIMKDTAISNQRLDLQSTSDIEKEMEINKSGIAVTGISSAKLRKLKLIKLDGVEPSRDSFVSGKYPYVRPLYLVTRGAAAGLTKKFLDFVLSDEGQSVVGKNAFTLAEFKARSAGAPAAVH